MESRDSYAPVNSKGSELRDFTNLAAWAAEDWRTLDIYQFILANYRRYAPIVINKIGSEHFPLEAHDLLPNLFVDRGIKPLRSVHDKNLAAIGEKRNQVMLGTLKEIARTRIVESVIKEFPFHESLEYDSLDQDEETTVNTEPPRYGRQPIQNLFTETTEICVDRERLENEYEKERETRLMLEVLRSFFTNNQYQHLKARICEGKSFDQIAEETSKTVSNARITLKLARDRMFEMLTEEQQYEMKEALGISYK